MCRVNISADKLVNTLLGLPNERNLCLLDSCGVNHLDSHRLIAAFDPIEIIELNAKNPRETLLKLDEKLAGKFAAFFTISYEFGLKLENIQPREKEFPGDFEPDIFLALFDVLIVHDYATRETFLTGNEAKFDTVENLLLEFGENKFDFHGSQKTFFSSNFTKNQYIETIEKIQEFIRRGDTYQTNLTQQIRVELPENLSPEMIFLNLRKQNPASFAAFLRRPDSVVISASPERFFTIENQIISASPIKGTRRRGANDEEDSRLQNELLFSAKDRAENVMIVDLLRNDLGRICEFGSVAVKKLCALETHPTLFHLVSTINGKLRGATKFSNVIRSLFPCGSITGAPKISTMRIIDEIETVPRGLSMGAIGYSTANSKFRLKNSLDSNRNDLISNYCDLSVAIRTMIIKNRTAVFNVGGGITIDSVPADEYDESILKAKALLRALCADQ